MVLLDCVNICNSMACASVIRRPSAGKTRFFDNQRNNVKSSDDFFFHKIVIFLKFNAFSLFC